MITNLRMDLRIAFVSSSILHHDEGSEQRPGPLALALRVLVPGVRGGLSAGHGAVTPLTGRHRTLPADSGTSWEVCSMIEQHKIA